ncbi:MAG: serpin family protein [Bacteroidales bacterium]|nr:serpin family protein [Bacteroidales bacterium]
MKSAIFALFSLTFFSFTSCENKDSVVNQEPIKLTSEQKLIVSSSNTFGLNIFKTIAANTPEGENIFVSPLSISMALSMLYNGAATQTLNELKEGLGYSGLTDDQINTANRDLIKALIAADPKVAMEIANSIWYKNTFQVEQNFLTTNKDYLNSDVRSASFDAATKDLINSWVSDKTHAKIPTIVDEIPAEAIMYLINAIYFKGTWKYKFDQSKTQKQNFYMGNGTTKQVDFMVQEGSFEYADNDLFTAVNMPYGDGRFSMMALVPKSDKTINDVLAAMSQQNWDKWNNSLVKKPKVKIYLPKFKLSYKKELNEDLQALGMSTMFTDMADLTRINKNGNLQVSKVMHKTFVDVNEEGTEAAAVTSVEIVLTSAGPDDLLIFSANKPFIYVIKEKDSNTLLFMGIMNEPVIEN